MDAEGVSAAAAAHTCVTLGAAGPTAVVFDPDLRRRAVILLYPTPPLAGVSIGMQRGCQRNESLADGWVDHVKGRALRQACGPGGVSALLSKRATPPGSKYSSFGAGWCQCVAIENCYSTRPSCVHGRAAHRQARRWPRTPPRRRAAAGRGGNCRAPSRRDRAVVIMRLHPPLPLAGVSIGMQRGCKQSVSCCSSRKRVGGGGRTPLRRERQRRKALSQELKGTVLGEERHCLRRRKALS